MPGQLVLASSSPRRKELLEKVGFSVKQMPAKVDESIIHDETPENYVRRIARAKVLNVVERIQQTLYPEEGWSARIMMKDAPLRWVLGADTVVVFKDEILGKPKDHADAVTMLSMIQGNEHLVITGFCIFDIKKSKEGLQTVQTLVRMKKMSHAEIEKYLAVGESMDKAGAYAIQGVGGYLVESIQGSYTNVVGLPVCQVVEMLQEMGASDVLPF